MVAAALDGALTRVHVVGRGGGGPVVVLQRLRRLPREVQAARQPGVAAADAGALVAELAIILDKLRR